MNQISTQQEFLPTDLVIETTLLMYYIPVAIIIMGLFLFFLSGGDSFKEIIGIIFSFVGTLTLCIAIFISDAPNHKQNIENLKTNIQAVYDVDDVTVINKDLQNGATIKINNDGKSFEVVVNWDPETYKPTIAPTTATVDEISELEK